MLCTVRTLQKLVNDDYWTAIMKAYLDDDQDNEDDHDNYDHNDLY